VTGAQQLKAGGRLLRGTVARDLITPVLGAATGHKLIDKVFAIKTVKHICGAAPPAATGV